MSKKEEMKKKLVKGIVEEMENGVVPWKKPWKRGRICRNWESKREYSGINRIVLPDGEYMTFYQAKKNGFKVRKGASGYTISVPKKIKKKVLRKTENEKGEEENELVNVSFVSYSLATVFNIDDIEGAESKISEEELSSEITWDPIEKVSERIEKGIENVDVRVDISKRESAYYVPDFHQVYMPEEKQFSKKEDFYRVYLHELGHSTGHETVLNRELRNPSNRLEKYAKEELVAEIFSLGLMEEYGLTTQETKKQQVAYIEGWKKRIKEDPDVLIKAANQAFKAIELFEY